jgi:hypothetical protein
LDADGDIGDGLFKPKVDLALPVDFDAAVAGLSVDQADFAVDLSVSVSVGVGVGVSVSVSVSVSVGFDLGTISLAVVRGAIWAVR